MPVSLELVDRDPIAYESAKHREDNFVLQAAYVAATNKLYQQLWDQRRAIAAVVRHHLGLGPRNPCTVTPPGQWLRGSFNVCIPVEVEGPAPGQKQKLLMRCPLPHRLAEVIHPGTVDEKLGCEVGAYVWMQDHCPDTRIPHLYGFGFSEQRESAQFTHKAHRPLHVRIVHTFWRLVYRLLGYPTLSCYTAHAAAVAAPGGHDGRLSTAYLLLEYIGSETGRMLSTMWKEQDRQQDPARRQRLFRGLARILLSLARVPQPQIGAFHFDRDGTVSLTNRPLTWTIVMLENEGTPRTMHRHDTYNCTEAYVSDMLTFHDGRFLSHPNAVYDAEDCRGHMAIRMLLRTWSHVFINRQRRFGPFVLQLTDVHASNIFVDDDWNITCLVDLEWMCALPVERLNMPYWLAGDEGIDLIRKERLADFGQAHAEFVRIVADEEEKEKMKRKTVDSHGIAFAQVMRDSYDSNGMWFWHCLSSLNAMYSLVEDHISPSYGHLTATIEEVLSRFWCEGSAAVVEKKVAEHQEYMVELRRLFAKQEEGQVDHETCKEKTM